MEQNLETDPHTHARLISDKGAKAVPWRKDCLFFPQMFLEQLDICREKKQKKQNN